MKTIFHTLTALVLLNTILFSQTGSVELKTGGGTLVSTHASVQEAYNAIPTPMTQSYLIEILPSYNQSSETIPITLTQKDGASPTNTITIRPATGNTGEVISATSTTGILVLNGADYVILDGRPGGVGTTPDFKLQNLATTGSSANTILFQNGATNNIVRYVHVVNSTQNTAGPRAIMFGTGDACSFNTIEFNKIQGGRSGIGIAGSATTPCDKIVLKNNEIFDWGYAGIWLVSGALNTDIDSNKIYQTVGVNNTIVSGIIMSTIAGAEYNIRKNWIYDLRTSSTSSSSLRGIYSAAPAAGCTISVSNNMISNTIDNGTAGQTITGIEFLGSNAYTLNLYYNTALVGGTHTGGTTGATTSAAIRIGATNATINMKNNIAINKRTGGNVNHIGFALVSSTIPTNLSLNYNCYFANGTNSYAAWWGTTGYNVLNDYKTAAGTNEQNTIFKDVSFNSITNLHLVAPSDGDPDLAGIPISGITTDIDGQVRDLVLPYRGADEATTIPVELVSFNSLVDGNNVTLTWTTATETNNYGFEVLRKTSNSDWEKIGFVAGAGNSVNYNLYRYLDNNLTPGIYSYRLRQLDYSGTYKNYDLTETIKIGVPERFELSQNYPNPFNPSTIINYSIPQKELVSIKLYDVLGNQIAELVNEVKEAGNYTVEFNAVGLSSGVYYYQLKSGDFISTKKMMLIK